MAGKRKSVTGLKKETSAAIASLLGPTIVIPVIIFLLEEDSFVRFYAVQSVLTFVSLWILGKVFIFSIILIPFYGLIWVAGLVVWLIITYKAWQGDKWQAPVIGNLTEKLLERI